ncbi:hypothetical protein HY214_01425 [Candidatus Roizmanbacteria bacterium]|nr:hypothetical protein [Candidatus Roizmanbacteria bacterium]
MNLVIPLAGKNPQFRKQYKPFVRIGKKLLIEYIVERHQLKPMDRIFFVILKEDERKHNVQKRLQTLFGRNAVTKILEESTAGAPCSILKALESIINSNRDLMIELADVIRDIDQLYRDIKTVKQKAAAILPVAYGNISDRPWGYAYTDPRGNFSELKEKIYVDKPQLATMGLYYFSKGSLFVRYAKKMIKNKRYLFEKTFYVGPVFNELIKTHQKVICSHNIIKYIWGTPSDITGYKNNTHAL